MTVKRLIECLQALGTPERLVVLAKDSEGNGFSPLPEQHSISIGGYQALDRACGELVEEGDSTGTPCIVLWPTT